MPHSPPTLRAAAAVEAAESALVLVATILAGVDAAGGQSYHVSSGIALTVIGVAAVAAMLLVASGWSGPAGGAARPRCSPSCSPASWASTCSRGTGSTGAWP
jgi:hypothetical protein